MGHLPNPQGVRSDSHLLCVCVWAGGGVWVLFFMCVFISFGAHESGDTSVSFACVAH